MCGGGANWPAHFKNSGMSEHALCSLVRNGEWDFGAYSQTSRKTQVIPIPMKKVFSGNKGIYLDMYWLNHRRQPFS